MKKNSWQEERRKMINKITLVIFIFVCILVLVFGGVQTFFNYIGK